MKIPGAFITFVLSTFLVTAAEEVDFNKHVKPILEATCLSCHGPEKPKGDFRIDTRDGAMAAMKPGKPDDSKLYTLTILPPDHDDVMPPKKPLTKEQTEKLRLWIEQGAKWPEQAPLKQVQRIEFVKHIQPILEFNCVACHRDGHDKGDLRLDIKAGAMAKSIVPFDAGKSS